MCGFVVSTGSELRNKSKQNKVIESLKQRGPTSQKVVSDQEVVMAFARLALLDLSSESDQPYESYSKRYSMVFNGEIYNYQELAREYLGGHTYEEVNSDTKVLSLLWETMGPSVLGIVRGMYGLCVLDRKKREIVFGRDRLGIKPLYFGTRDNELTVGSTQEVLSILGYDKKDDTRMDELLLFGSFGQENTGLVGVKRCKPGEIYIYSLKSRRIERRKAGRYRELPGSVGVRRKRVIDELDRQIRESLEYHLRTDTKYSLQLSGGVDSSLLTALCSLTTGKKQRTFSINIPGFKQDEKWAREKFFDFYECDHTEVSVRAEEYFELLVKATKALDAPVIHSGSPALYRLYEEQAKYAPMVLVGEGADEAFLGYSRYKQVRSLWSMEILSMLPERWLKGESLHATRAFTRGREAMVFNTIYSDSTRLIEAFPSVYGKKEWGKSRRIGYKQLLRPLKAMRQYDREYYLQELLARQDGLSMRHSVEARTPFADIVVYSFADRFSGRHLREGMTKAMLKELAARYLPNEIVYRKKIGLNLPLDEWIREDSRFRELSKEIAKGDAIVNRYGDNTRVSELVNAFMSGELSIKEFDLFKLICVEVWLRTSSHGYGKSAESRL